MKIYYLASPYTKKDTNGNKDRKVMAERAEQATKAAVDLLKLGVMTFAPIPYNCHWEKYDLPSNWEFWERFDKAFIDHCDGLIILMMEGWRESVGVNAEIEYAKQTGKEVLFLRPSLLEREMNFAEDYRQRGDLFVKDLPDFDPDQNPELD